MSRSTRIFILSLCTTLIALMLVWGIAVITENGQEVSGTRVEKAVVNTELLENTIEVTDNFLTFFAPEIKAAAHFSLIMCAALSEIY